MNPHKSKSTVADYCDRFDFDEVLYWTGYRITRTGPVEEHRWCVDQGHQGFLHRRLELNHLWSNGQRPDARSNLIRMLKPGHDWFHANLPQSRVLAVTAKLRKREKMNDPAEFDLGEMRVVTGRNVSGIIAAYDSTGWPDALKAMREECLERLERLECEA